MDDFKLWYYQKPLVTRTLLTMVILAAFAIQFGFPYQYLSLARQGIKDFQVWRIVTNYFVLGGLNLNLIFDLFILYMALSRVESLFDKYHLHDLLWLYLFAIISLDIIGLGIQQMFLIRSLELTMIYIWSKRKPFEQVMFYFGLRVKSAYLPWVFVAFHYLVEQQVILQLIGIFVGHAYIYIKDILPVSTHKDYLQTPKFFENFVKKHIYDPGAQQQVGFHQNEQHQWQPFGGRGVRLN